MSAETATENTNQYDETLGMSDEDFLSRSPALEQVQPTVDSDTSDAPAIEETAPEEEVESGDEEGDTQPDDEEQSDSDDTSADTTEENSEEDKTEEKPEKGEKDAVDYKAFYDALTKPFKANGQDFQVTDPNDMITLMQQGANYTKKMTEIKPLRRIGKLLADNELMNEEDLAYLIDLKNKNPEAIAKLLKDSEVDLYEFDTSQGDNYRPQAPNISDSSIELQSIIEDLRANSPTYNQTIKIVGNDWDSESRDIIAQNPQLLTVLDSQVADGTFEHVNRIVQYERAMGRLNGISDIQAYKEIGDKLYSGNSETHNDQTTQQQIIPPEVPKTPSTVSTAKENTAQKKAAASPRQTTGDVKKPIVDPFNMTDEEFMKATSSPGNYL